MKTKLQITNNDRMYVYLWSELQNPTECKFGERWVKAGLDPKKDVYRRVRQSINVEKHKLDDGRIVIKDFWDVTDIAKKYHKYYKNSKVDDFLRNKIGFRKGATGEFHDLPVAEMHRKVNQLLIKMNQPLPVADLSTSQYNKAVDVLQQYKSDAMIILAELCARFGKTIWSGAVANELDSDIVIVASYVKTVFTSFAGDLTSFQQFAQYEHIDTQSPNYQEDIRQARANGKKIIVYLSLCQGTKRQERINFLFAQSGSKFLIIDEADFGAHQKKQADPLSNAVTKDTKVLIMTGTNGDRAVSSWVIDYATSITYPELLLQKKEVA